MLNRVGSPCGLGFDLLTVIRVGPQSSFNEATPEVFSGGFLPLKYERTLLVLPDLACGPVVKFLNAHQAVSWADSISRTVLTVRVLEPEHRLVPLERPLGF